LIVFNFPLTTHIIIIFRMKNKMFFLHPLKLQVRGARHSRYDDVHHTTMHISHFYKWTCWDINNW